MDGLLSLMAAVGEGEFLKFMMYVVACCKNEGRTFVGCLALNYPAEKNPIDTLADSLIALNLIETPLGLSRRLTIFKRRGAPSDTTHKMLLLDGRGRVILR